MMLREFKIALLGVGLLMSGLLHAGVESQAEAMAESVSQQSMRYFDGRRWRTVWVNPQELAEFAVDDENDSLLRSVSPGAKLVQQGRKFRIWKIDQAISTAPAVTRSLNSADGSRFAPVFQLSASGGSPMVLTGNIIVRFKHDRDQQQLLDWAQQLGLQLKQKMSIPATYLFFAGQGTLALEKAELIQEGGEVKFAVPEWWRQAYKR